MGTLKQHPKSQDQTRVFKELMEKKRHNPIVWASESGYLYHKAMNVFIQIPRKHVSLHFLPSCIQVAIRQQQTATPAADSCHKIQAFDP